MNNVLTASVLPSFALPRVDLKRLLPTTTRDVAPGEFAGEPDKDRAFVDMLRGFRDTGGLARGDEVADLLRDKKGIDVSQLARWIVGGELLSFQWRSELWVPLFQFNLKDMSKRAAAQRVVAELAPAFDGWALSHWFVQPNAWLGGRMPVEVVESHPAEVFQAARTDRFVALG